MIIRLFKILLGSLTYMRTGETPDGAYQSLIRLFCKTQGRSNDLLHAVVRRVRPTRAIPRRDGILGSVTNEKADCLAFTQYADDTTMLSSNSSDYMRIQGITSIFERGVGRQ